jgi:hypothetical protein
MLCHRHMGQGLEVVMLCHRHMGEGSRGGYVVP